MTRDINNNSIILNNTKAQDHEQNGYTDIHCHCLPGIDDGPDTMAESLALCRALVADGITNVIATPHQLGQFNSDNKGQKVREEVSTLNEELKSNQIALNVLPGGDVRVDERILQLLESDQILTLADGGKYILLELPHQIFIDIESLIVELSSVGIQVIISHPERHFVLGQQDKILLKWIEQSVQLQITAGSLIGQFGYAAQKSAWHLLDSGLASLVATDSHNLNSRRPCMSAAFERIRVRLGNEVAQMVCIENPLGILKGKEIVSNLLYEHNQLAL